MYRYCSKIFILCVDSFNPNSIQQRNIVILNNLLCVTHVAVFKTIALGSTPFSSILQVYMLRIYSKICKHCVTWLFLLKSGKCLL